MTRLFSKGVAVVLALSGAALVVNALFSLYFLGSQESALAGLEARAAELRPVAGSGHVSAATAMAGVERFSASLPEADGLTAVLEEVFEAARKRKLRASSGSYAPETIKDSGFSRYSFSLPVSGSYPEIKRFIYEIESSGSPLVVEEVSLASGSASQSSIGLSIKMSVYYR